MKMDFDSLYKIYELYFQRIFKEYDLVWSKFKSYLWFNTALLIVIGVFSQQFIDKQDILDTNQWLWLLLLVFSIFGLIFAFLFYLSSKDGKRWELLINDELKKIEEMLFSLDNESKMKKLGLYTSILQEYTNPKIMEKYIHKQKWRELIKDTTPKDIADINIATSKLFFVVWLILTVLFSVLSI